MRTFTLVLLAALGASTAALAQSQTYSSMESPVPQGASNGARQDSGASWIPSEQWWYDWSIANLRDKMLKIQAKDGGQLTPEHAAALQRELDRLNRKYRIATR